MTMPAPQPPAGPPPTGDPSATPPPGAPPAVPAAPYGTPPQTLPQHPLPPGAPPAAPPYVPQYPPQYPPAPAGVPSWPSAAPAPTPGDDDGGGGFDLSRLPKAAREEISRLREQVQRSTTELRTAQVSQQAHALAAQSGVNPAALLGSTAWAQAVSQLDPGAPDFAQRLSWTVQAVAQANPWMQAPPAAPVAPTVPTPAPPASGADFSGAAGGTAPITETDLAAMSPQQVSEAWKAGRLKHLM